jgi:biofilm PGA synthesis lipoprotein PgaB
VILIGWFCLSASICAQALSFIAPKRDRSWRRANPGQERFLVLAYHDVEDDAADQRYLSVRTSALNEQISWLCITAITPSACRTFWMPMTEKTLPPKAVLLSFDDGYSSFYTRVWPLLQAWNVPALWAPVGSWVDTPANQKVNFGGLMTPRDRFATWDMVRELSQSPLIEIGAYLGLALRYRPTLRAAASLPSPIAFTIRRRAAMKPIGSSASGSAMTFVK